MEHKETQSQSRNKVRDSKHFQTENLKFFVLSGKCYGLSRVEFYLYLGISILLWIYNVVHLLISTFKCLRGAMDKASV